MFVAMIRYTKLKIRSKWKVVLHTRAGSDVENNGKQVIFQIQVISFKSNTRCCTVCIVELLFNFMRLYAVGLYHSRQFGRKVLVLYMNLSLDLEQVQSRPRS